MKRMDSYILTNESLFMVPEYDHNGRVCTLVQEGGNSFIVSQSPRKILAETLKYFGNTFEGAVEGARDILGNHHMLPIVVCAPLDMYWFPTQSVESEQCVWISLLHIERIDEFSYLQTIVHFDTGESIIINKKAARIINKQQQTAILKIKTEQRFTKKKSFIVLPENPAKFSNEFGRKEGGSRG